MVAFASVKAGDVLYDVRQTRMGNTTMRRWGWWEVRVIEIDHEAKTALVSWNGNAARKEGPHYFASLRRSIPEKAKR